MRFAREEPMLSVDVAWSVAFERLRRVVPPRRCCCFLFKSDATPILDRLEFLDRHGTSCLRFLFYAG